MLMRWEQIRTTASTTATTAAAAAAAAASIQQGSGSIAAGVQRHNRQRQLQAAIETGATHTPIGRRVPGSDKEGAQGKGTQAVRT